MSTYLNMLGGSSGSVEETDPIFSESEAANFETGDKDKLDGIEDNANNYTLEAHKSKHSTGGTDALSASDIGAAPSDHVNSTTGHPKATALADGFMSKEDFSKLDGIEDNANNYTLEDHGSDHADPESTQFIPIAVANEAPGLLSGADMAMITQKILTKATSGSLTVEELKGLWVQIHNLGQTLDCLQELPLAEAGIDFEFVASATVAKYYRFKPKTGSSQTIRFDGQLLTAEYYVGVPSITIGDSIRITSILTATGVYNWRFTTGSGNWQAQA